MKFASLLFLVIGGKIYDGTLLWRKSVFFFADSRCLLLVEYTPAKMPPRVNVWLTEMALFDDPSVPTSSIVLPNQKGGDTYIFDFSDDAERFDTWRQDGYLWKQDGKIPFFHDGYQCYKIYFKLKIGYGQYTKRFSKSAFINAKYPAKVLLMYVGDVSLVVPVPHKNAKTPAKLSTGFVTTSRALLRKAKRAVAVGDKYCHETFAALDRDARQETQDPDRLAFEGPRDIKQIRNVKAQVVKEKKVSSDGIYTAYQIGYLEGNFITNMILLPSLIILMCNKGNTTSKRLSYFLCFAKQSAF